jgi:hypothetical protein
MSYLTMTPSDHDLNTAIAILDMKKNVPELKIISADGGFPFKDIIVPDTPSILGYKPDAICSTEHVTHLIEIKSYADLVSSHSKKQYEIMKKILQNLDSTFFNIYVFGEGPIPFQFFNLIFDVPSDKWQIKRLNFGGLLE